MKRYDLLRRRYQFQSIILFLFFLAITGTIAFLLDSNESEEVDAAIDLISSTQISPPKESIGCHAMVTDFCHKLYGPEARGNVLVKDASSVFATLQGETKNDFELTWYSFYRARLERAERLPGDLREILYRRGFFKKLALLIKRPSRKQMEFSERVSFSNLEDEVDSLWDQAIEETTARRLEKKFPGAFKFAAGSLPQDVEVDQTRTRAKLWSEISLALWRGHPNWKRVENDFRNLQAAFLKVIESSNQNPQLKEAWANKIKSVKLSLPGENPVTANRDCISVTRNAYYYPYLNTVTVCAGYFTGGAQILTLAHELAHALDFNSRLIDSQQNSALMKEFRRLKANVCSEKFDCNSWASFKTNFQSGIDDLLKIEPEVPAVHACLQKTTPQKKLTNDVVREKSDELSRRRFSDMTQNSAFFRLTNKEIQRPDGTRSKNRSFLNPCAYDAFSSDSFALDSELSSLIMFTSAYRCSDAEGVAKLKDAVSESKKMTEQILQAVIQNESTFSAREVLQSDSYSSPPTERFADRIGSYAAAEYLNSFKGVDKRRAAYLASSFWLCEKPSLRTENLEQYQALSEFIIERGVHPVNEERIKDWLSEPIQQTLSCKLDFAPSTCSSSLN